MMKHTKVTIIIDNIHNNNNFRVDKLSFDLLDKMTVLTELRLDGLNLQIDTERPISLKRLIHLKTFVSSLTVT